MAQPVVRTPDFPDFDSYPGGIPNSERLLPKGEQRSDASLNHAAGIVGGAAGSAVNAARGLPRQLNAVASSVKSRLTLVKKRGVQEVTARAADVKQAAVDTARNADQRARRLAHEHPLSIIAGTACVAFVAGLLLRIWRERRA